MSIAGETQVSNVTTGNNAAVEKRLADVARYLSSDELEGRGIGTKGIDLAADYIADQLRQLNRFGVRTDIWDGGPFQKFEVGIDAALGTNNHLALVGPSKGKDQKPVRIELVLGKDYTPLAISGKAVFNLPLAFAGYGISAPKAGYDDFAGIDAENKAVIMLRRQPHDDITDTASAGIKATAYTVMRHKAANAFEHGAAAMIFCDDKAELRLHRNQEDALPSFHVVGPTHVHTDLPVLAFRRAVLDRILHSLDDPTVSQIEDEIDRTLKPASRDLTGWRIQGQTDLHHVLSQVKNVAAVLPGEGPLADEAVVLTAHYDHLGYGSRSTLPTKPTAIYHGADDNASGVAVVLEVARRLAQRKEKLHRTVVFVLFTGEEWGFWGSSHYVNDPAVPMNKTVANVNLDMVGRLRDDFLQINSVGTGLGFDKMLDELNGPYSFHLLKVPGASGRSDQAAFYAKQVPDIHFITGKHPDYHKPTDTFDKLNIAGMRRVADYVQDVVVALANARERPTFVSVPMQPRGGAPLPFLGCIPDFTREEPGYPISSVIAGSPAERCGIKGGDVIVRFGRNLIGICDDLDDALQQYTPGEHVKIKVRRKKSSLTFEATLAAPM